MRVANFGETAVWVVGVLFFLEFVAVFICLYRTGAADEEEGRTVTERMRVSGSSFSSNSPLAARYLSRSKVFVSRSGYISEMSLVDGTATIAERLIARGIKLAFFLFWLTCVFGILALLPSDPGIALTLLLIWSFAWCCGINLIRKSRADALRRLAERRTSGVGQEDSGRAR
jgi:hypothetical protein